MAKPQSLFPLILEENTYFSVDQVARFIVSEDSTIQLIDLRSPEEFAKTSIPGSINIPYEKMLDNDPGLFLNYRDKKIILYSNGDFNSDFAFVIARGLKYTSTYVMKGGLNEWFRTIMNSNFTGERISARENALFEARTRAAKLYTEINSLPDSLKQKLMEARHSAEKKLDGGCE